MLPPAVQNFLDLSSDPDFDGYQADTSINTNDSNDSTRSSTPIMTLSDDFLLDPSNWTSDPLRARLMRLRDLIQQESTPTIPTSTLPVDDPSSVTEPESEPENPPQPAIPTPTLPVDDPSSMTEPESEPERSAPAIPTPTIPVDDPSSVTEPESEPERAAPAIPTPTIPVDDPSSVTEPESEPENPPQPEFSTPIKIKGATPVPKKKGFFDTPSPPGPNSLYWKYISREEDDRWYDHLKTDDSFDAVRQMKQQLRDIT
ncbi:hypothetical protein EV424DRAFT_1535172 [Suillus variegatus]|nr:hypothetical protein EV424DRAFT_1535172 [Suillus variegatus]